MVKHRNKRRKRRLKVTYAEANRVRLRLLSEDVQALSKRDVQTLLRILDDVYPVRGRKSPQIWQPFLIGIGIGILLVLGLAMIF